MIWCTLSCRFVSSKENDDCSIKKQPCCSAISTSRCEIVDGQCGSGAWLKCFKRAALAHDSMLLQLLFIVGNMIRCDSLMISSSLANAATALLPSSSSCVLTCIMSCMLWPPANHFLLILDALSVLRRMSSSLNSITTSQLHIPILRCDDSRLTP